MHSESQIGKRLHCVIIESTGFKPPPRPIEALAQRSIFVSVSRLPEQTKNLVCSNPRLADGLHRGIDFNFAGKDSTEEQTFKLTATSRTLRVDAATIVFAQHGARLWSFRDRAIASAHRADGKAELLERVCVIAGLKLDVPEQHAIAAHAAGQTQAGRYSHVGHRVFHSSRTATKVSSVASVLPRSNRVAAFGLARPPA